MGILRKNILPLREYHMVCFHGFRPTDCGWESAYEALLNSFVPLGIAANQVALDDVPSISEEPQDIEKFSRGVSQQGFPCPSMLSLMTDYRFPLSALTTKSKAFACVSSVSSTGGRFFLASDAYFGGWSRELLSTIGSEAWRSGGFDYGYALTHRDGLGFSNGVMRPRLSSSENVLRKKWQDFLFGFARSEVDMGLRLRDVFPFNFLKASHLTLPVEGISLADWVSISPRRGEIKELADDLWTWEVPDRENRRQIRTFLNSAGLLVAPGGWEG